MEKTRKELVMRQIEERCEAEVIKQFRLEWPKVEEVITSMEVEAEYQYMQNGKIDEGLSVSYVPEKNVFLMTNTINKIVEDVITMGYNVEKLLGGGLKIYWN